MTINEAPDKEMLYTAYHRKVKKYVSSRIANASDVEDLVSQVFLKVYKNLERFDNSKASVSTWIYTITRNVVIDFFRTQNNSFQLNMQIPSNDTVDDGLLREELLDELASALETLEKRERDLIILHYYSEKTLVQIAQLMHISYPYAKILHKNAINKLKKYMMSLKM